MQTDTVSIAQFVADHGITISSERTSLNHSMPDSRNMDHWKVTLRMGRKRMTLTFSMGYGHGGHSPEVEDVLDCLASDASSAGMGFNEFCDEFGYDSDSRSAERTYKALEHQDKRLRNFLGMDLYAALLETPPGLVHPLTQL